MSRALACAAVLVLCSATVASAALPRAGALVPGRSLAGIHLGETGAQVRAALGRSYGVCRGCAVRTWYFTYLRFDRRGLAVELAGGRVSAVYTLWQPAGWSAPGGLKLGTPQAEITNAAGPLIPVTCSGYDALTRDDPGARTVYYVVNGSLWGFGLMRAHESPCR
jgi:hypothetical protein